MRDYRKKLRRLKFKKQDHPIMVMQEDRKHFYLRYCFQTNLLKKFGYHNHWEDKWIVFHVASGLMIRKFKTEREAQMLAKHLELHVREDLRLSPAGLRLLTAFMGGIKLACGRNLQVCTEDITGIQRGDIPF